MVDLARGLGLGVVAEGVETEATWQHLSDLGCTSAQGYYLSRPLPADDVLPWIATHRAQAAIPAARAGTIVVGARDEAQASSSRRPENARPRVTSSAYSRSPPTGSPLASRLTRIPSGVISRPR